MEGQIRLFMYSRVLLISTSQRATRARTADTTHKHHRSISARVVKSLKTIQTPAHTVRRAIDGSRLIAPASQGKLQLRTVAARVP